MVTVEELREKWGPARNVPPHGECIIVPGSMFDPDWEHHLALQDYKCIYADLDMKPVVFIKLQDPLKEEEERLVHARPQQPLRPANQLKRKRWYKPDEDKIIIDMWNDKHAPMAIFAKLQKINSTRTLHSVKCRIRRLKKAGKISSARRPAERPAKAKPEKADPAASPVRTGTREPETPDKRHRPCSSPEDLRKTRSPKPEKALVCFESYCRTCRQPRSVEDSNVWAACPICRGELIIWNVKEASDS